MSMNPLVERPVDFWEMNSAQDFFIHYYLIERIDLRKIKDCVYVLGIWMHGHPEDG